MSAQSRAGKAVMLQYEAEGLIKQVEEVASGAGFGQDVDFTRMCDGLRALHKTGGVNLESCSAFHVLVKDALQAKTVHDKVAALKSVDEWHMDRVKKDKKKDRQQKREDREKRKHEKQKKTQMMEALRIKQDNELFEKIENEKRDKEQANLEKKKLKLAAEQGQRREEAKLWRKKQEDSKAKQEEQERMITKKRQNDSLERRKLLEVRRKAELARTRAEQEQKEANAAHFAALREKARLKEIADTAEQMREKEIESEIARRVKDEVRAQLRNAMEEGGLFNKLELEMHDATQKAQRYQHQALVQKKEDEAYVIEEDSELENRGYGDTKDGSLEDEETPARELSDDEALGDYGDSDDEGFQMTTGQLGYTYGDLGATKVGFNIGEEMEIIEEEDVPESFEEAYAKFNEKKDAEERAGGGGENEPSWMRMNPPQPGALKLNMAKVSKDTAKGPDSPMSPSFWTGPAQHATLTPRNADIDQSAVKSRVGAAVERARRMAVKAQERASERAENWTTNPPLEVPEIEQNDLPPAPPPVNTKTLAPKSTNQVARELVEQQLARKKERTNDTEDTLRRGTMQQH